MQSDNKILFLAVVVGIMVMAINVSHGRVRGSQVDGSCLGNAVLCHIENPNAVTLKEACDRAKRDALSAIDRMILVPCEERTFQNTLKSLDELFAMSDLAMLMHVCEALELVAPTPEVHKAAHENYVDLNKFFVDHIGNNRALYDALKEFSHDSLQVAMLTKEQKYFLDETMDYFKRAGLDSSEDVREKIGRLKKEIADLGSQFEQNIAQDGTTVVVEQALLDGVPEHIYKDAISDDGLQVELGLDYPTYFTVMETAKKAELRKKMYQSFSRRGYPVNDQVLKGVIKLKHELAQLLGYSCYAELDLADQMVKNPETARTFLTELSKTVSQASRDEFQELLQAADDSVILVDGKLQPWDGRYLKNEYKKRFMQYDEQEIAKYFPIDYTVSKLLEVYADLFNVTFQKTAMSVWHEDVFVYSVLDAEGMLLGHVYFDLYPRKDKYTHACCGEIVPATFEDGGSRTICRTFVIANFPKGTAERPGLLKRDDVKTFFHELGHGLHHIFGRTNMASQSGTQVKTDFVELPSQMLEHWIYDRDVLKRISRHYKTGEPLSDELISKIIAQNNFCMGGMVARQVALSEISLNMHTHGGDIDPLAIEQEAFAMHCPDIMLDPQARMYASFGHLTNYCAKYYGYMWSRVFAYDLFDQFKEHGITNPVIGKKYVDAVIGRGGSADPNELLKDFLGREPNQEAFKRELFASIRTR